MVNYLMKKKKQLPFNPLDKEKKQNGPREEEFHEFSSEEKKVSKEKQQEKRIYVYHYEDSDDNTFFPGRRAYVYLNNLKIGTFGIVHPTVCKNFDIVHPTSALELNIEAFLDI